MQAESADTGRWPLGKMVESGTPGWQAWLASGRRVGLVGAPLLCVFLLAPAAVPALSYDPAREAPVVERDRGEPVRLLVAYAPLLRQEPLWWRGVLRAVAGASQILDPALGRPLKVVGLQPWPGANRGGSLKPLLRELEATILRRDVDIVVGLTRSPGAGRSADSLDPQRPLLRRNSGLANFDNGYVVVSLGSRIEDLGLLLAHELAHVFGAVDWEAERTLLHPVAPTTQIGAVNAEIIRLHRDRLFSTGQVGVEAGRIPRLIELYTEAKRTEGAVTRQEAGVYLARFYNFGGRYEDAIVELEAILLVEPDLAAAHAQMGYAHLMRGDFRAAAASTRRALELEGRMPTAWVNLGVIAARQGRYREAAESFERAVTQDPTCLDAHVNLGHARLVLRDLAGAEDSYLQALELWGDDEPAPSRVSGPIHNNLALIDFDLGLYEEAWEHAEDAAAGGLSLHPEFIRALEDATGKDWPAGAVDPSRK